MADLAAQTIDQDGLEAAYAAAAAGGDSAPTGPRVFLHVKNGHSAPQTVTVHGRPCDQGTEHDQAVVVTNAEDRFIGPLRKDRFGDGNDRAQITYSGVTALTVAVLELD